MATDPGIASVVLVLIEAWISESTADLRGLDAELQALSAAAGALELKAGRVVARVSAQAEQIADAICEAGGDSPGPAADRLLEKIGNLPSGDPDSLAGAVESIDDYRKSLTALSRSIARIGTPAQRRR